MRDKVIGDMIIMFVHKLPDRRMAAVDHHDLTAVMDSFARAAKIGSSQPMVVTCLHARSIESSNCQLP